MIHNSRATVYISGLFFPLTLISLEKHDRFYWQNIQYLQGQAIVFDQSTRVDLPGVKTVVPSYRLHLNTEGGINSET